MKIIKNLLIIVAIVLLSSGCGAKKAFVEKEAIEDAALLYIFIADTMSDDEDMQDADFKLRINTLNVKGGLQAGEYKVFDMKPATILLTAIRTNVEEKHLKLKLEADKIYYVEVKTNDFDSFQITEVSGKLAQKDIKGSVLAGSFEIDTTNYVPDFAGSTIMEDRKMAVPSMSEAEIDAMINKKLDERSKSSVTAVPVVAPIPVASTPSVPSAPAKPRMSKADQMDELERAHAMKVKGILSDAEFKAMKSEILAK